jgi:thiol-disulfide isomerase/thioredoxin
MTRILRGARGALKLFLAVALGAAAAPALSAQESGIPVGSQAPDAALETLDGAAAKLGPVIAGKPAVIEFWATWCPNCRALEPTMVAAQKKYGDRVVFVGVSVSVNQSPERVRRYTAEHLLGFTHFYDRRGDGVEAYDVPATSYVVVVDRTGRIVYTGLGESQDIEGAIQKALK